LSANNSGTFSASQQYPHKPWTIEQYAEESQTFTQLQDSDTIRPATSEIQQKEELPESNEENQSDWELDVALDHFWLMQLMIQRLLPLVGSRFQPGAG
jgi:hypothetical protein